MVLVGFFCVLGAIGLLVAGLLRADPDLVWSSIGASAVGGLAVVAASIQRGRAARRSGAAAEAGNPTPPPAVLSTPIGSAPLAAPEPELTPETRLESTKTRSRAEPALPEPAVPEPLVPESLATPDPDSAKGDPPEDRAAAGADGDLDSVDTDDDAQPDPPDEPAEEDVDMADLLIVIDLTDEVLVVDLRPRYHLAPCNHLDGREAIPLPVNEAREDGFTPCTRCGPDALLAAAARALRSSTPGEDRARPRPEPG